MVIKPMQRYTFFLINNIFYKKFTFCESIPFIAFDTFFCLHLFFHVIFIDKTCRENVDCFKFVWSILVLFVSFFMSMQ